MSTIRKPDEINHSRRRFVGAAAVAVAAAQLDLVGAANAQADTPKSTPLPAVKPGTNTSFGSPEADRRRRAQSVGYAEAGPADGPVVILLHGWPYDIYSYVDVAPVAGLGRLPRARPVPPRLRRDAVSFKRDRAERSTLGGRG